MFVYEHRSLASKDAFYATGKPAVEFFSNRCSIDEQAKNLHSKCETSVSRITRRDSLMERRQCRSKRSRAEREVLEKRF